MKDVLRKPFFTYETQKVSSLLAQMRENLLVFHCLDEYGVTAGLITLEDIVEEILENCVMNMMILRKKLSKIIRWILYGIRFFKA